MKQYKNYKPEIRELTIKHGLSYPTDEELVMMILGSGTRNIPVAKLSEKIVEILDSVSQEDLPQKLTEIKGIGISKSLAVLAGLELGRRRFCHKNAVIKSPSDLIPFIRNYSIQPKEHFLCITLNGSHEIIQIRVAAIGTVDRAIIHPREIFSEALKENANSIIVCHNHPSGNCTPSEEDIQTTKILIKASMIIGIQLLDHIIFGTENYFSFLENKLLFEEQ